jgi:hypothetical protein
MDVNRLLDDLRADIQEGLRRAYIVGWETDDTDLLTDICEAFDNLDVSLSKDGCLPDAWKQKEV